MRRITRQPWMLLLSLLLTSASAAWTQIEFSTDTRDPATAVKLNLSTPGARSLAMGGAFLGLADDATAAYTNPAGLSNLTVGGSEVAVEVRQWQFNSVFPDKGHYNSVAGQRTFPTFIGQDSGTDGLELGEAHSETSGLSFLSFGYVMPGGLVLALYRHELGNFRNSFESQGPFNDFRCGEPFYRFRDTDCELWRVQPTRSSIDLEIVNYGLSAGFAFDVSLGGLESSLSLGIGLSYYEAEMSRLVEDYAWCRFVGPDGDGFCEFEADPEWRQPGGFFGPPDFSPDNRSWRDFEAADDDAFGVNVGFLWKLGREQRFSVGGVFRQGPDFETEQTWQDLNPGREEFRGVRPGKLTVPDVIGVGVAYRSAEGKTKIAFDANRVRYAQTLVDFTLALEDEETRDDYTADDIDQLHLGFERTILVVESLFVGSARFGVWNEPFHDPRYIGEDGDLEALYVRDRPTDDEIHLSAGLGLVIKEDYQIDMAVDVSDPVTTVSFSLVKFF